MVDDNDRPLGTAPRGRVHAQGLKHRAVHVLLFDPRGRLYLQKRAPGKDTHPGKWTSSASGHVDPGESYPAAAQRELAEELCLHLKLHEVGKLPASPQTENEFTAVYRAVSDLPPRPNPAEISQGRFFEPASARRLAGDPAQGCPSLKAVLDLWAGESG